jgi:hypothetical protein
MDDSAKVTISAEAFTRLHKIKEALQYIIDNKNNFTDKHPLVRDEAEAHLDRCAALLDKGDQ